MTARADLIIFTRYPEPGTTKTRMIPALGEVQAAELQKEMTESVVAAALNIPPNLIRPLSIHFSGGSLKEMNRWLGKHNFTVQQGKDIGERMEYAFNRSFSAGAEKAIVVGSDIPGVDSTLLFQAISSMAPGKIVLGPSLDGGYYLIGICSGDKEILLPELFHNIAWSSSKVFETTFNRVEKLGFQLVTLPPLRDMDTPEDLKFLQQFKNIEFTSH